MDEWQRVTSVTMCVSVVARMRNESTRNTTCDRDRHGRFRDTEKALCGRHNPGTVFGFRWFRAMRSTTSPHLLYSRTIPANTDDNGRVRQVRSYALSSYVYWRVPFCYTDNTQCHAMPKSFVSGRFSALSKQAVMASRW